MKKTLWTAASVLICLFCGVLTVFSKTAAEAASSSLSMCLTCLIPSLFPYMVASSMLVSCGAAESLSKICPVAKLFGLPKKASGVIILGALCGFPLGAKMAVEFYKKGIISKSEAEVLVSVSNNTGPSFVVAVIGAGFWNSAAFGWKLYFLQLFAVLISGIVVNRIISPVAGSVSTVKENREFESFSVIFSRAVTESVSAVLGVCGFVMFFSVVCTYIRMLTDPISPIATGGIFSLLELTGASEYSAMAAASGFPGAGGFFAGFALGFSGLSVFCQSAAFTLPPDISLKRTFAVKLLQGIITGVGGSVIAAGSDINIISSPVMVFSPLPCALIAAFFALAALNCVCRT